MAPLLKGAGQEDQTPRSNYGSIGNERDVTTAKAQKVSAENEEYVDIENDQVVGTRESQVGIVMDKPNGKANGKNTDQTKSCYSIVKSITQGMLNYTLLRANVYQLKRVMNAGNSDFYFYLLMVSITLSIILQIVAGALIISVARCDLVCEHPHDKCIKMNDAVAILIFVVTAINISIPYYGQQL